MFDCNIKKELKMSTTTESTITLKGSTEIVTEFFNYSVNSILYQRGIYPPESFKRVSQYGLSMMVTTDEGLLSYLNNIIRQLECMYPNLFFVVIYSYSYYFIAWLMNGSVQKLILVVKGVDSGETLERWAFDCETTMNKNENKSGK